jgi:hypothetical protein
MTKDEKEKTLIEKIHEAKDEGTLHPQYMVQLGDSQLVIRFVGNTAVVAGYNFMNVDPYQMLGAAEDMKRKAFQMLQAAEIEEAKRAKQSQIEIAQPVSGRGAGQFVQGG